MGEPQPAGHGRSRFRSVASPVLTVVAGVLVWFALVLPDRVDHLHSVWFVRLPLEALVLVALALLLRGRARTAAAVVFGLLLSLLIVVKTLDMGFTAVLDRPFDPVNDWFYLGPAVGVLGDSVGRAAAVAAVVGIGLLALAVLAVLPWSAVRLARLVAHHRRVSLRAVITLAVAWVVCAVTGLQLVPTAPVASTSATGLAYDEVSQVRADLADGKRFAQEIDVDRFRGTPNSRLLTGLRGKDVILAFVESYGRVAVQGSEFSPGVDAVLDAGTRRLKAAGFSSRSAFLTSPTFGAGSWLAHSTLQSGLWVDSQQRYNQLVTDNRLTLTSAFGRAGWRTVFDSPAITKPWADGARFYHFGKLYDATNVGYRGPTFSYASMPDQYTLAAFRRHELARTSHRPVMAEIDLVSSHHPWTPLPHLVSWNQVGNGSVFDGMPAQGPSPEQVFQNPAAVRAAYGQSIEYTMNTLVSFLETYPDPNLVLVVLGDHQPHSYVTGDQPGHDVPITLIAHDKAVLNRVSTWGWQDGLRPGPHAPVWRMDAFRDRFLTAFGPQPSGPGR